jgi:proteic killer suppression protein
MKRRFEVIITAFAEKQMRKLPKPILEHVRYWAESIERLGLAEVRKLPGYHDEPLKGQRKGQRSIRLNRAYRLIYEEDSSGELVIVAVLEVNKHEY